MALRYPCISTLLIPPFKAAVEKFSSSMKLICKKLRMRMLHDLSPCMRICKSPHLKDNMYQRYYNNFVEIISSAWNKTQDVVECAAKFPVI